MTLKKKGKDVKVKNNITSAPTCSIGLCNQRYIQFKLACWLHCFSTSALTTENNIYISSH